MKTLPIDFLTQLKLENHTLTFLFKLDLKSGYTYYSSGTAYNSEEDPYHIHPGTGADFLNNITSGDEFKFAAETIYIPIINVNADGTLTLNNNPTGLFNGAYSIRKGGTHSYCWTSFDDKISYGGNWYFPKGINFNAHQVSLLPKADSITLEINNVDNQLSDLALANEIRGKAVTIYQVALDNNNQVIDALTIFFGYTDTIEINQRKAIVEVYNHMIKWRKQTPRRNHFATCPWVFGDSAHEVIGTDASNYRCVISHVSSSSNRPITGSVSTQYWTLEGIDAVTWINANAYSAGTCDYRGVCIQINSGGTYRPIADKWILGNVSGAGGYLKGVQEDSGTWVGGDIAGYFYFRVSSGTFSTDETLTCSSSSGSTGLSTDCATVVAINSTMTWCDQSYDRCVILGMTSNFGGFRWLPGLADKNIIWGRNPSNK